MATAFETKYQAVRKLATGQLDGPNTRLVDWMAAGEWRDMSIQEMADEWNDLEKQNQAEA